MTGFSASDFYRAPDELTVHPTALRRVLIVGACIADGWADVAARLDLCQSCDHILFNHLAHLPDMPPHPVAEYDFQLIALPMRTILPEREYMSLDYNDLAAHEALFAQAKKTLALMLDAAMQWNKAHGLTTFVANFFLPQQNPAGRLLPRYDFRNPVYFMERLNRSLNNALKKYRNTYLLDADQISASLGRRHVQDDAVYVGTHNSYLQDFDWPRDQNRLEIPAQKLTERYGSRADDFIRAAWRELIANLRILRQQDSVKLVITDLDDMVWHGIALDLEGVDGEEAEGWPMGYLEALSFLKKRGIVLAVVSRNDETAIREAWPRLLPRGMGMENFAFIKINWRPKSENIAEILAQANLLPGNAVFIDDNPVEREGAKAAFPGLRVLGGDPYALKRVLLWSAETQIVSLSDESARRTQMMQAQVAREETRAILPRAQFLAALALKLRLRDIVSASDPQFPRMFELLNKTNQFNSTGRRWTAEELQRAMAGGLRVTVFTVEDRFTRYGLVGIVLTSPGHIDQFVMSCRVLGLDVELAALALLLQRMPLQDGGGIAAAMVETPANFPVRDLYRRGGFNLRDGAWVREPADAVLAPGHIDAGWQE